MVFDTSHAVLSNRKFSKDVKHSAFCWTIWHASIDHFSHHVSKHLLWPAVCVLRKEERTFLEFFSSAQNPQKRIHINICSNSTPKNFFSVIIFTSEVLLNKLCFRYFLLCNENLFYGGKSLITESRLLVYWLGYFYFIIPYISQQESLIRCFFTIIERTWKYFVPAVKESVVR